MVEKNDDFGDDFDGCPWHKLPEGKISGGESIKANHYETIGVYLRMVYH